MDKAAEIGRAAADAGAVILRWKKIVLRNKWQTVALQNPTYSQMLCFGVQKGPWQKDMPDVIIGGPTVGGYGYGTPVMVVDFICKFLQRWGASDSQQVVDPFVGRDTTLAMAEKYGFSSLGIDNDRDQCEKARQLTVDQLESLIKMSTL